MSEKFKIVFISEGGRIEPDPFLPTREETSGYDQDSRSDAETHNQDPPNQ